MTGRSELIAGASGSSANARAGKAIPITAIAV
jgi:hypothetical protein